MSVEIYNVRYFPAEKKLQEQQTDLLFDAKIKTGLRILKQMHNPSVSLNTGVSISLHCPSPLLRHLLLSLAFKAIRIILEPTVGHIYCLYSNSINFWH